MPCWKRDKHDILLPSRRKSRRTIIHSRKTRSSLRSSAQLATHIPDSCSNIRALVHKTPRISDASSGAEVVEPNMLFLEGYSKWRVSGTASCTEKMKSSPSQKVVIGVGKPAYCSVSNEHLLNWTGFESQSDASSKGNYLCAFVLGWSYVLSARLIELRRKDRNDCIHYTDDKAGTYFPDQTHPPNLFQYLLATQASMNPDGGLQFLPEVVDGEPLLRGVIKSISLHGPAI